MVTGETFLNKYIVKSINSKHFQGFQDIQNELNVCITCLDGGVTEMEVMARPGSSNSDLSSSKSSKHRGEADDSVTEDSLDAATADLTTDETEEIAHMDEVFEAFISHDFKINGLGFEDDFVPFEEALKESKQSKRVMSELKSVLNGRMRDTEERESKALQRQKNIEDEVVCDKAECGAGDLSQSLVSTNILGQSQETDSDAASIRSGTSTVKSQDREPALTNGVHRRSNGRCPGDTQSVCSLSVSLSSRTLSDNSDSNLSEAEVRSDRDIDMVM